MTAAKRREYIEQRLRESAEPVSASQLSGETRVSRQVVVGDIALMRAGGLDILATPRGYILAPAPDEQGLTATIACVHGIGDMAQELYTIIDHGGAVLNVIVEHPVYGQLTGPLHLFSRFDVDEFAAKLSESDAAPLSKLTDGIHLHTIRCRDEQMLSRIKKALKQQGLLLE